MTWALSRRIASLEWLCAPLVIVAVIVAIGAFAERVGIVRGWYASPFVLGVVYATLRNGTASGYIAAIVSMLAFNFWFVAPVFAFSWPTNEEWMAYASMFGAVIVIDRMRPIQQQVTKAEPYKGRLPFVRERDKERDRRIFWDVQPSGRWLEDCMVGREYGRLYLERVKSYGAPVLSWIVCDMIRAGRYTGVEAGFVGAIAASLPARAVTQILVSNDNADDLESD